MMPIQPMTKQVEGQEEEGAALSLEDVKEAMPGYLEVGLMQAQVLALKEKILALEAMVQQAPKAMKLLLLLTTEQEEDHWEVVAVYVKLGEWIPNLKIQRSHLMK